MDLELLVGVVKRIRVIREMVDIAIKVHYFYSEFRGDIQLLILQHAFNIVEHVQNVLTDSACIYSRLVLIGGRLDTIDDAYKGFAQGGSQTDKILPIVLGTVLKITLEARLSCLNQRGHGLVQEFEELHLTVQAEIT